MREASHLKIGEIHRLRKKYKLNEFISLHVDFELDISLIYFINEGASFHVPDYA